MINSKRKQKGKIGQAFAFISVVMTIKSTLWDNLTPEQKKRLTNSAVGVAKRTEAKGKAVVHKLDNQARKLVDTVIPTKNKEDNEKDKL